MFDAAWRGSAECRSNFESQQFALKYCPGFAKPAGLSRPLHCSQAPRGRMRAPLSEEVGSDVVATGSGAIDLTGLVFVTSDSFLTALLPRPAASILIGGASSTSVFSGLV